jgi:hypothetical protein
VDSRVSLVSRDLSDRRACSSRSRLRLRRRIIRRRAIACMDCWMERREERSGVRRIWV